MTTQTRDICVEDLGLISYTEAYALQQTYVRRVQAGEDPRVFLCEHPPVITLGRSAREGNLLFSREQLREQGIEVTAIDRGGDVTLHAPGQLVIYPIVGLENFGKDLRRFLHQLEQVAIDFLGGFGIVASRFPSRPGVWIRERKIASIGIGVKKWVSFHGLAININTELNLFKMIRPCGYDIHMTSLAALKGAPVNMDKVKTAISAVLRKNFQTACKDGS